jgi:hypothetical protein
MGRQRRSFSGVQKRKRALEAIREQQTINELASARGGTSQHDSRLEKKYLFGGGTSSSPNPYG